MGLEPSSAHRPPAQGPGPTARAPSGWNQGAAGEPVGTEHPRQEGACLRTQPRGDFTDDSAPQTRRWGPAFQGGAVPGMI